MTLCLEQYQNIANSKWFLSKWQAAISRTPKWASTSDEKGNQDISDLWPTHVQK